MIPTFRDERIAAEVAAYHLALRALGVEEARAAVQHAVVVDNDALARLQQRSKDELLPVDHRDQRAP